MKIYCINLARSADRRAFQLAQAQRLGLDIEFVDAVDYKSLPESALVEAAQHWTREIAGKDVGCFYSHRKAWQKVSQFDDLALIIEDDVVFSTDLPKVLQAIERQPKSLHRVYDLEFAPRRHVLAKNIIWQFEKYQVKRVFINKIGAGAYVLGKATAIQLVRDSSHYVMVDSWLWTRPWIEALQVNPCVAAQIRDFEDQSAMISSTDGTTTVQGYKPRSWFRKKCIRLRLTLDQLGTFCKAIFQGQQEMLQIDRHDFVLTYPPKK